MANYPIAPPVTSALLWQRPIRGLNKARDSRPFLLRSPGRRPAPSPPPREQSAGPGQGSWRRPGPAVLSSRRHGDMVSTTPHRRVFSSRVVCVCHRRNCLGKVWGLPCSGRPQFPRRVWPTGTRLGDPKKRVCVWGGVFRDSGAVISQKRKHYYTSVTCRTGVKA